MVLWVDPLDGTSSFVRGEYKHVTVCIGVAASGKAVAGIVHQPFVCELPVRTFKGGHDYSKSATRTIWAVVGGPLHGIGSRKHLREASEVILVSQMHGTGGDVAVARILHPAKPVQSSGAAYKALCVLEDEADVLVYASGGTKKWDTCAVDALFQSRGGRLTDLCGDPIDYSSQVSYPNSRGVLASLVNHESYVRKLAPHISKGSGDKNIKIS